MEISNEKCSLYTGLLSQFVEFSATLWFYPRIRGKVTHVPCGAHVCSGNHQHFGTDGREVNAQWLLNVFKKWSCSPHNPHHKYRYLSVRHRAVENRSYDRSGCSDRTLWQNTIGKDFSDLSSLRSPEASHTSDTLCLQKFRQ